MSNSVKKNIQTILDNIQFDECVFVDDQQVMENWSNYGLVKKDVCNGELFKITDITECKNGKFNVYGKSGVTVPCILKKEKKFFSLNNIPFVDSDELESWINSDDGKKWFIDNDVYVSITVDSHNILGSLSDAYFDGKRFDFINQKDDNNKVYFAKIKEKNNGGFLVDIGGIDAFLPGSLAAANIITNFDSLIGKEIPVMFEDYLKEGDTFIVSNKKYIKYILPEKIKELEKNTEYEGKITGTAKFGLFVEFNDIMTGLLHTSEMVEPTLTYFKNNEYRSGDTIKFYIKEIAKDDRIILTEKNNIEEVSIDEFAELYENTLQFGEITAIKQIGTFVKFTHRENVFTAMIHKNNINVPIEFNIGEKMEFFISKVDCVTKKIFLKLPFRRDE